MKNQELFELKGKHIEFNDALKFKEKIDSFIGNDFSIPMVTGYDFAKNFEGWEVKYLHPVEIEDELTVKNFMCGLEKFVKDFRASENFKGSINIGSLESTNKMHYGEQVLSFYFSKQDKVNCGLSFVLTDKYDLSITYAYSAESYLIKSEVERLMGNYLGPKRKEGKFYD